MDFILAVGGGSVIDCCKIISVQAKTNEDIWNMEFVQRKFPTDSIPVGAVVTASGTGAEMNAGAVITNEALNIKTGVFGATPRFAVLDPAYTMSVPQRQVISGAFDTLSHAMETYFGQSDENNASDDIAEAVMKNTIRNMKTLLTDINNYKARSNLMWDSAMAENGILKLGRKTAFQAHQIEHQLGAYTDCNHGQGLAVLHPVYYKHIYKDGLSKFARFAVNVWGLSAEGKSDEVLALAGIDALSDFIKECGLPTHLTELNMKAELTDARSLASHGIAAYCFDFRGGSTSSRSDGSTTDMTVFTEVSDLNAIINMVKGLDFTDTDKLFLLDTIQERLATAAEARSKEANGEGVQYPSSNRNSAPTREELEAMGPGLYSEGQLYYGFDYAHPNSGGAVPTKCLLDLVDFDARHNMNLITQPLLMMAGSEADTLYMTEDCFNLASGTENKELFLIDGASHIQTYYVEEYVNQEVNKLIEFFGANL